jgi:hypothetical protein
MVDSSESLSLLLYMKGLKVMDLGQAFYVTLNVS